MRDDFDRVVINTGRHQGYPDGRYRGSKKDDYESDYWNSHKEPMSRYSKELSDRLSPLYRYLKSNVGRPWSKVWSDVCQLFDNRKISGYHIREHILMWVSGNTISKEYPWKYQYMIHSFYVDKNGILKLNSEYEKRWANRKKPKEIPVDSYHRILSGVNYINTEFGWFSVKNLYKLNHSSQKYDPSQDDVFPNLKDYIPISNLYAVLPHGGKLFLFKDDWDYRKHAYAVPSLLMKKCDKHEIRSLGIK